MDDVINAKVATIERCLKRIKEEVTSDWKNNFTHQDALLLNLERACQAAIDAASHVVRVRKFGLPKQSREVFDQLASNQLIDEDLAGELKKIVGFRNIALHDYASLNLSVVEAVVSTKLPQLENFCKSLLKMGV